MKKQTPTETQDHMKIEDEATKPLVWAIYARVSTTDQDAGVQLHALRKHIQDKGLTVFKEYVDTVTGSFEKRQMKGLKAPALDEMMADVREGRVNAVMVWKFDRFARSLIALVSALAEFNRLGVAFLSLTQNIDLTSPTGRLMFQILAALAEWERELIIERTKAGLEKAKAAGKMIGRSERDPSARERVLEKHRNGFSLREIAAYEGYSSSGIFRILQRALKSEQMPARA